MAEKETEPRKTRVTRSDIFTSADEKGAIIIISTPDGIRILRPDPENIDKIVETAKNNRNRAEPPTESINNQKN